MHVVQYTGKLSRDKQDADINYISLRILYPLLNVAKLIPKKSYILAVEQARSRTQNSNKFSSLASSRSCPVTSQLKQAEKREIRMSRVSRAIYGKRNLLVWFAV